MLPRRRRARVLSGVSGAAPWVVSYPGFVDTSDFVTTGFWTVDADGGLHATYDALPQRAVLALPQMIDLNRPFHFGALFEFNGAAARCAVRLESLVEPTWHGISAAVADGDVRIESGNHGFFLLGSDMSPGDLYWLGVSWVNGRAVTWCHPVPEAQFGDPVTYLNSLLLSYAVANDVDYDGGSNGTGPGFEDLVQLAVDTSTDSTRVLAMFVRQGDFLSGPSDRIEPPLILNPAVNGDVNCWLFKPSFVPATDELDLVILFHGANSSELAGIIADGNTDGGVAIAALRAAGFAVAAMRGTDDGDYGGALASNFGATYALQHFWKAYLDRLLAEHTFRNIYCVGLSMGLLNALNFYHNWPTGIKAIAGISGLANLAYAYTNEGFKAVVDLAHGSAVVGDVAAFDPTQHPAYFAGVPIALWHGDADATLDSAQHMDAFAAAVNGAGGSAVTHSIVGADHLEAPCFDGPALRTFFQAHT